MTFQTNRIYYLLSREGRNNLLIQLMLTLLFIFLVATGGPIEPFVPLGLVVFLICFNLYLVLTRPKQIYLMKTTFRYAHGSKKHATAAAPFDLAEAEVFRNTKK